MSEIVWDSGACCCLLLRWRHCSESRYRPGVYQEFCFVFVFLDSVMSDIDQQNGKIQNHLRKISLDIPLRDVLISLIVWEHTLKMEDTIPWTQIMDYISSRKSDNTNIYHLIFLDPRPNVANASSSYHTNFPVLTDYILKPRSKQ